VQPSRTAGEQVRVGGDQVRARGRREQTGNGGEVALERGGAAQVVAGDDGQRAGPDGGAEREGCASHGRVHAVHLDRHGGGARRYRASDGRRAAGGARERTDREQRRRPEVGREVVVRREVQLPRVGQGVEVAVADRRRTGVLRWRGVHAPDGGAAVEGGSADRGSEIP